MSRRAVASAFCGSPTIAALASPVVSACTSAVDGTMPAPFAACGGLAASGGGAAAGGLAASGGGAAAGSSGAGCGGGSVRTCDHAAEDQQTAINVQARGKLGSFIRDLHQEGSHS